MPNRKSFGRLTVAAVVHLREAVALEDQDVERVEELGDLARERRAAGVRDAQPPAEPILDLRVDEPVGEPVLGASSGGTGCVAGAAATRAGRRRAPSRRPAAAARELPSNWRMTAMWIFS